MTEPTRTPLHRRAAPLTAGLLSLALGLVVLLTAHSLLLLRDGGWPWHASITTRSDSGPPSATAEIDDNGEVHRYTGTPAEAHAWLDRTGEELKRAHGITAKIAAGEALRVVGVLLLTVGAGLLLWRRRGRVNRRAIPVAAANT